MSTERWIGDATGQGLTYGTAVNAADVNSMANGSGVLSSVADITNGTALAIFADFSVSLGSVTTVAPNYLGVYMYPLNQDASTYGDNLFPTAGTPVAAAPSPTYWVGNIIFPIGTQVCTGTILRIIMPPGSFRFLVYNQLGVTLAASANVLKYRTYNRQIS